MEIYGKLQHPAALAIFIFTLIFPVALGFFVMKRTRSQADFFIGGRAMSKFVVALSAVSSGRSGWLVLGMCGAAYVSGTSAVWALVGYIVVEMVQFIYIGRRLRIYSEEYDAITLLDYFSGRFADHKNVLRVTGAIIMTIFLTAYVAAQFSAGAQSLSLALNIPVFHSLIITAVLILVYIVLGGFIAVSYNDVVRAFIMIIGLVVFPVYGLIKIGGLPILLEMLQKLDPRYLDPLSLSAGAMTGFLGIGLGSPGQPHVIVRYMSIDHADKLRFSTVIGTIWNVIMGWGALLIGLLGRALFPSPGALPDQNPEMIYLALSSSLFDPIVYGFLIGGIFAAILSTADSQLLVVASTIVRDIHEKCILRRPAGDERRKLRLSRIVVIVTGVIAVGLAWVAKDLIFWLVLFAWGGLGASLGPVLILSLYWKRSTRSGALAGMISGTLISFIWKLFLKNSTGLYELIPAFFGSLIIIIIVSLWTQGELKDDHR